MTESQRVREIVVLGGGSAGWLSALYLQRGLHPDTRITVVDSPRVGIIGVGEATIPTIQGTMRYLGFAETTWMPRCEATYKLAVRLNEWLELGHSYYHPFWFDKDLLPMPGKLGVYFDLPEEMDLVQIYGSIPKAQRKKGLADYTSIPRLCNEMKAPRQPGGHTRRVMHAYHFDAALFANYLESIAVERGIRVIHDHVVDVALDERGFIASLRTESGLTVPGEFFIDCTGFAGRLINQALKEPFLYATKYLPCTAAVATQVPYEEEKPRVRPYTTAAARGAGWIWEIPLRHRTGAGYVYSPEHISSSEAEAELRRYMNFSDDVKVNHIKARVGRNRNVWVKNCVSIGLSGSFVEPLESTSIATTEFQLFTLLRLFPSTAFEDHLARRYNEKFAYFYDQIRDFIVLHYKPTRRDDTPFWRMVQHELPVPDSVGQLLGDVRGWVASSPKGPEYSMFPRFSWASILDGMDILPDCPMPIFEHHHDDIARYLEHIERREAELLDKLPDHLEYFLAVEAAAREQAGQPVLAGG